MNYYIDTAKKSDANDICNLLCRSIKEICGSDYLDMSNSFMETWLSNKTPQNIRLWIKNDSNKLLVVKTNTNEIIGVSSIDKKGMILLCYVLPEFLGKAVGKFLLDEMIKFARDWRLTKVFTYSTRSAKEFYLKNGFTDLQEYTIEEDKIVEYKVERVL